MKNSATVKFSSKSENECFARMAAAAFVSPLDPTIETLSDIKTAVSEAVTNAIIHGYEGLNGIVSMNMTIMDNVFSITISDTGHGIEDVRRAMTPLYTSKPDMERSGMGFTVMESFMDTLKVVSKPGEGTRVTMTKRIL